MNSSVPLYLKCARPRHCVPPTLKTRLQQRNRFYEVVPPWWVKGAPTNDFIQCLVVAMRLPEP